MSSYREPARLLRLMAHPMRLEILTIVRWSDECVCHLSAALKKPQPYVSQQLAVLRNAGLIADHKEGNNVFYGLASGRSGQVAAILGAIDEEASSTGPRAHKHVEGCYCPKCEPEGTCSPPVDQVEVPDLAQNVG
jgi:DNA-binding transcriptional ArsR family regulator